MGGNVITQENDELTSGSRLGIYEILEPLGAGAMGQVYRARDSTLEREVAIKVLPRDLAANPERLGRFQREAKSLAALNNSNIAQIYAVDHIDDTHFLSLELVPGESLEDRLARGPLPLEDALRIGRDIAEGLEAAHEAGVVHRDLKPANVRVTAEGVAKLLDFGLAKPTEASLLGSDPESALTMDDGRLIGTPTYMAPEQVGGKPIDRRADIWAFGCVLYECLSGKRAFDADSLGSLFAAIATESVDVERLRAAPAPVRRLIERCLRKDPRQRLRDIGDARVVLEDVLAGRTGEQQTAPKTKRSPVNLLVGLLLTAVVGAAIGWAVAPRAAPVDDPRPHIRRYSIALPSPPRTLYLGTPSGLSPPLAISPNGQSVVFAARNPDGERRLYLRTAPDREVRPLEGTDGAASPFFAPDGKRVAFTRHGGVDLFQITLADGSVRPISHTAQTVRGVSWGENDMIVFALQDEGLFFTRSIGEERTRLTHLSEHERDHRWPQVLPGGKAVLFTAFMRGRFQPRILDLDSGEATPLPVQGSNATYLPSTDAKTTGFLVYLRGNELWAVRVDIASATTTGDPKRVVTGIQVSDLGNPNIAFSAAGVLVYEPARPPSPGKSLVWLDREGNQEPLHEGMGYEYPRLSPTEPKVVFANHTEMARHDIWTITFQDGLNRPTKITSGGNFVQPVWSSTGDALIFTSFARRNLWIMQPIGSEPRELLSRPSMQMPLEWSEDRVLFHEVAPGRGFDVLELNLETEEIREVIKTVASDQAAVLSPERKWIAYVSDETGRPKVYVRRYDPLGPKEAVSDGGGDEPVWSKDGRELFFRHGPALFVVRISEDGQPTGQPKKLFEGQFVDGFNDRANYDVTRDGKRFVMVDGGWGLTTGRLDIHLEFVQELERALPR